MAITDVVLVTGANGGLGTEFVHQALARGATKVYASARNPREWADERVVPLTLDVTDPASLAAAVAAAPDVTLVVNNAGASNGASVLGTPDALRDLFEVNFFAPLAVADAFAPALAANGGGALLNVLSVLSWIGIGDGYSATKAALWSATNTQRLQLAANGTLVTALHLGYTDTPMTAGLDVEKNDPADVVAQAYDGLLAGAHEVLADDVSRQVKHALAGPLEQLYPQLSGS
ncbi:MULTISPECIES: SDR family oxidoreductase [unclassified Nocardioides]|uniref:SDR family oxidoreductase n=1 Tax=unclassified Nocardioides TaxID=2615069 RepID=UPI0006F81FA5|nr:MULTISPECIES: SDR family oxidoreductase [unclassified Nocardioides]KRA38920.1 short-chain dehydrogenase [Nocardioides sp. Root614]KRA92879.1 short-chain dehydrogenase [Nocardioides sp. Root682]